MSLMIGKINNLIVLRKTDIGYILISDNNEEVFLHNNESNNKQLKKDDKIQAFLYYDSKKRIAATLTKPIIEVGERDFLEVVDINYNLGVFLDNGINKDLLLSKDYLPENRKLWPRIGEEVYVKLNLKTNLVAEITYPKNKSSNKLELDKYYYGIVQKIVKEGIKLLTKELNEVFINKNLIRKTPHIGEVLKFRVVYISKNGYSASLIKNKEDTMLEDSKQILSYLKKYRVLPLNSNSTPNEILKYFKLSKRAFKRAIGNLYKERLVYFENNYTIYIGDKNE